MMKLAYFVVLLASLWPSSDAFKYARTLSRISDNFGKATARNADNIDATGNYGGYSLAALGAVWRSNAIAGFNKMKEGELAEAMQDFRVAISTLAVWDLGQGVALPIYDKIVNRIILKHREEFKATIAAFESLQGVLQNDVLDEAVHSSEVLKGNLIEGKAKVGAAFESDVNKGMSKFKSTNIYKDLVKDLKGVKVWAKALKWGDVFLGPIFDMAAVGFNIWSLTEAIKTKNTVGIATSSLGIAAGVAGITGFAVGALATAGTTLAAVAGPIGAIIGVVLGITGILIEVIASYNPYGQIDNDITMIKELTMQSKEQVDIDIKNLHKLFPRYFDFNPDFKFSWVFEMNQGLALEFVEGRAHEDNWAVRFNAPRDPPKEEDGFMIIGRNRNFDKSNYANIFWNPEGVEKLGYDFYGKKASEQFNGVTVIATTGAMKGEPALKGLDITTYNGREAEYPDNVLIGGMAGIADKNRIYVKMGGGDDTIVFSGLVGRPGETNYRAHFMDKVLVETTARQTPEAKGHENNVLSFQGMSANKIKGINGVEFDMGDGNIKYLRGSGDSREKIHWGHIEGIKIFVGTPFDDIVKFPMDYDYKIRQTKGNNEYIVSTTSWGEFAVTIDDQSEEPGKVTFVRGQNFAGRVKSSDLVFIKDTNTLLVYGKRRKGRYFIRGKIVFNRKVEGYHVIKTTFDNTEKRCNEFPSTFEAEGATDYITSNDDNQYYFDRNLESSSCGVIKVFLNPPDFERGRFRIYFHRRKNEADMLIMKEDFVAKCLKMARRSLTLARTGFHNHWHLRLSGETDNKECPGKNFEIELMSFEKFYQEKGNGDKILVVDLGRDRRSFIDVNHEMLKLDKRIAFFFTNEIIGAPDISDVVILEIPTVETPSTTIKSGLYLVGGKQLNEDSLVFPHSLRSWLKNTGRHLLLTKQKRASSRDGERLWRLIIIDKHGTETHSVELDNIESIDYEPQDRSLRQPIVTDLETMEAQTIDLETKTAEVLRAWHPNERGAYVCKKQ